MAIYHLICYFFIFLYFTMITMTKISKSHKPLAYSHQFLCLLALKPLMMPPWKLFAMSLTNMVIQSRSLSFKWELGFLVTFLIFKNHFFNIQEKTVYFYFYDFFYLSYNLKISIYMRTAFDTFRVILTWHFARKDRF